MYQHNYLKKPTYHSKVQALPIIQVYFQLQNLQTQKIGLKLAGLLYIFPTQSGGWGQIVKAWRSVLPGGRQ